MKVILYMAMRVDGFIANKNKKEDFLSDRNWGVFCELAEQLGCFIIGRKTYDSVSKWEELSFDDVNSQAIVISKSNFNIEDKCIVVSSPKKALVKASSLGFNKVLLAGGGKLNSSFMKEKLVDEVLLNIEPVVIGKGVKLFGEGGFERRLELINIKKLTSGIIQLHYRVKK